MAVIAINALSLRPGGGLQVVVGLLSRFSDRNTYLVLWSDPKSLSILKESVGERAHIRFTNPVGSSSNSRLFLWQMTRMRSWLRRHGIDAMLGINHHYPSGDVPQIIYHLNVLRFERPKKGLWNSGEIADRLRDWRTRVALEAAEANVFESEYLKALASGLHEKPNDPSIIYIGVNERQLTGRGITRQKPAPVILALTSPQPHKDNRTLVRTLAELVRLRPQVDWRLKVAGGRSPAVFSDLISLAEELGVAENVEWLGFRSHDELSDIGNKSLCLVTTSRVESFCMVALEAMSWNCPPIVADTTSMPESVGDAGLLAIPGNPLDFAQKVIHLHDHPDEREALVERGWKRLEGMTWGNAAKQFEAIFADLPAPDNR